MTLVAGGGRVGTLYGAYDLLYRLGCRRFAPGELHEEVPQVGRLAGIRDLQLGDKVQKTGRTTEHTRGDVETIGAQISVDYGTGKGTATFDDQVIVRGESGEFSQPGDSGSAVLSDDAYLGGLLFAGGEGITVVNRIGHVVSLLGVRL